MFQFLRKKINKKNNIINKAYIFSFFSDFFFVYSFYNTYFISNGIEPKNIALLMIVIQTTKLLFDIPCGIFADVVSRRNLIAFGFVARITFCILCLLSSSFLSFLFACIFYGISMSCIYSKTDAYFYDILKQEEKEKTFPVFMGKYYSVSNISIGFVSIFGGFLFNLTGFKGIFIASIITMLAGFFLIIKMPNYKRNNEKAIVFHIRNSFRIFSLIKNLIKKPRIIRLMVFSIILDGLFLTFLDINTTLMNIVGFSPNKIAELVGIVGIIRVFTNYYSGFAEKFMSFKRLHSLLLILMIFSIIMSFKSGLHIVFVVSLYLCIYPFLDTSTKSKIQKNIDSATRSTIMSFIGFGASLCAIIFNFIVSYVSNIYGYFSVVFCISILIILILFFIRNMIGFYKIDMFFRKTIKSIKDCFSYKKR